MCPVLAPALTPARAPVLLERGAGRRKRKHLCLLPWHLQSQAGWDRAPPGPGATAPAGHPHSILSPRGPHTHESPWLLDWAALRAVPPASPASPSGDSDSAPGRGPGVSIQLVMDGHPGPSPWPVSVRSRSCSLPFPGRWQVLRLAKSSPRTLSTVMRLSWLGQVTAEPEMSDDGG